MRSPPAVDRCRGFSLVELVAVIVLLGIVAAASTQFVQFAVGTYSDSTRRDNLTQVGRFAVERITRELRNALPGSVRVDNSGSPQCVEFVPVLGATSYINNLAGVSVSSFEVVNFTQPASYADTRAVIFPIDNGSVYASGSQHLAAIDSVTGPASDRLTVNLDTANTFPFDSPQRRVFIVGEPVSFCANDGQLQRYQGDGASYTLNPSQPVPPAGGQLLAEYIRLQDAGGAALDVFDYAGATQERNAVVTLDLRFSDSSAPDERVTFQQQVLIRNTP